MFALANFAVTAAADRTGPRAQGRWAEYDDSRTVGTLLPPWPFGSVDYGGSACTAVLHSVRKHDPIYDGWTDVVCAGRMDAE
jgi:hypothetical protein